MDQILADNDNNAPTAVTVLSTKYDVQLDPSSVTNSTASLTDATTGKKLSVTVSTSTDTVVVTAAAGALVDGKQYTLSISGVKSATGEAAEAYTKTFAVNAATPLTSNVRVNTLDGKIAASQIGGDTAVAVWPKLTSGDKKQEMHIMQVYN